MMLRNAAVLAGLLAAWPATAETLAPDEARRFVVGKTFAFTCFEGTRGAGRVQSDGSVAGSVQFQGTGPVRYVTLPPDTLRVKSDAVCGSVKGMPFEPCFNLQKTSGSSFRGSLSTFGMGFAYCDFTRKGSPRRLMAGKGPTRLEASAQASSPSLSDGN